MDSLEVNQYKSVFTIYTIYRYQNFQSTKNFSIIINPLIKLLLYNYLTINRNSDNEKVFTRRGRLTYAD